MRILISNDDGIFAPGIKALAETLALEHEIYVAAPDRERSANGHALTLHKPLRAEKLDIFKGVKASWEVNGTPSDCIKIAVGAILDEAPDMVVSGINRGQNMGTDVIYSGTVSAAMEGNILGIPSVAVSLASFNDLHYQTAADAVLKFLNNFKTQKLPAKTLLNINVPPVSYDKLKGVQITRLGVHRYTDLFEKRTDLRGRTYYWLAGEPLEFDDEEGTDTHAVKSGYVSITPIQYDLTNHGFVERLKTWNTDILGKVEV